MKIDLTLPEPPSANRYYRNFRGRMVRSAEANEYRLRVLAIVRMTVRTVAFPTGDIEVTLHWYRSRKSGDIDNRAKVALDSLNGLLWTDDKQIAALHLYRTEAPKAGKLHLTATAL